MNITTNLRLDSVKFFKEIAAKILNRISYAYPGNYLETSRSNGVLQTIKGHAEVMQAFVNALETAPPEYEYVIVGDSHKVFFAGSLVEAQQLINCNNEDEIKAWAKQQGHKVYRREKA